MDTSDVLREIHSSIDVDQVDLRAVRRELDGVMATARPTRVHASRRGAVLVGLGALAVAAGIVALVIGVLVPVTPPGPGPAGHARST